MKFLDEMIRAQKRGEERGIASICSAHPWVLQAVMSQTWQVSETCQVLIEATCNQVNQYGGYTGMKPVDFVRFVRKIARENEFPVERVTLGGDHLGPSVWQYEPAEVAMQKAEEMIRGYVQAGFVKIHLDASINLGDDPTGALPVEVSAARAARLAKAAEAARVENLPAPSYVIGTEVPVPGGAQEHEEGITITTVDGVRETLEHTRAAFWREGLESAWKRVIAVVVQPGVEFGDDFVMDYQPEKAQGLARFIESETGLVYEAHSTDYQTREALKNLVRDHFAILKVGPALTFAFREAVFALAMMENELFSPSERSNLMAVLEAVMVRHPEHWRKYYHGPPEQQKFARKFSLSDRARYYWGWPEVQDALERLITNLGARPIPLALLSQFAPAQYPRVRSGTLAATPEALILDSVMDILKDYNVATGVK
ncbi:MAG TPA: D-tagatose-bisphosphate aldolase, class II, non-catalytic subunit [Anaerolineales bacterium]|nr:D-tagatose-bisphosphate aldolase, class II, non-catalytic subunit [Anaerolineales bacterium]